MYIKDNQKTPFTLYAIYIIVITSIMELFNVDLGLSNRVAIVTGSSRGIGKAIAYSLAKEGAQVTICARHIDKLMDTARNITESTGTEILPVCVDLRQKKDIRLMVERTVGKFSRIDILVNNTGGPPSKLFSATLDEDWYSAVDSLLMSVINCCRDVIPYMKENKWGRIINMTSFAAKQPSESLILSNTIRAGILGLTKTLSNELAGYGILVNAVCPGWTQTRRIEELAKAIAEKTERTYKAVIDEWASKIPLKHLAQPEEIANAVAFLASEKASYITGSVIQVDGGFIQSIT
jgi:3-oxoacyl-[acyl-carrier protein] reductase